MADPLPPLDDTTDRSTDASSYDSRTTDTTTSPGISGSRHLTGVLLTLLLVPAAYAFVDYSFPRAITDLGNLEDSPLSTKVIVTMAIAAGCFFAAGAAARISALGALLAGLVWGAAPTLWVMLDYPSYVQRVGDIPNVYDGLGSGLYTAGFALFPAVTGLLLGAAVAGRWRGTR
jgi:hypothetical protein